MNTRGVDERHLTHADDTYFGSVAHLRHHFLELGGNAEEIRTIDFVYLHTLRDDKVFLACGDIRFLAGVYLVFDDRDFRCLHHTAHEEHASNNQTHFNGYGQIEDDGQEEGDEQHRDVRLRIAEQCLECTPAAHVIGYYNQYARQAAHGDVLGQWHEQQ